MPAKRPAKVKVLFLCGQGEYSSPARKAQFREMLRRKKIVEQFKLRHAGVGQLTPDALRKLVSSHHYVVTCNNAAKSHVRNLRQTKTPAVHINTMGVGKPVLDALLKKIREEKGVRNPPRKK